MNPIDKIIVEVAARHFKIHQAKLDELTSCEHCRDSRVDYYNVIEDIPILMLPSINRIIINIARNYDEDFYRVKCYLVKRDREVAGTVSFAFSDLVELELWASKQQSI